MDELTVKQYFARDGQYLKEHLINVACECKRFASDIGCGDIGYLLGSVHDMGKYSDQFQTYLQRSLVGIEVSKGEVTHALNALAYLQDAFKNDVKFHKFSELFENVVASHHGGLVDMLMDGIPSYVGRAEKAVDYATTKRRFEREFKGTVFTDPIKENIQALFKNTKSPYIWHLVAKFLFSCLVDADRNDAAGNAREHDVDWAAFVNSVDSNLASFKNVSRMNQVRSEISRQCLEKSSLPKGVYTLSVPTGGGKTLSSLRFAVNHCREHSMKRIVYVIPYLSILDQTAKDLREKVFKDIPQDSILEHHSNFSIKDGEDEKYRDLTSRWNAPIILTTMVQFLETVMSNKASDLRKFHNMANSVFVFDEIQSLPRNCYAVFSGIVNFLSQLAGSTVVLCTATQPVLARIKVLPIKFSDNCELVQLGKKELEVFSRTRIQDKTDTKLTCDEVARMVEQRAYSGKSVLVILNTKSSARSVFESLNCEKYVLTTNLCPAHRVDVLEKIKAKLDSQSDRGFALVSTQLIEAGVDVSFDCVIRSCAGADSIVQAAGRCNRNGENHELGDVLVVDIADENLGNLPEIALDKNLAKAALSKESNPERVDADRLLMDFGNRRLSTSGFERDIRYPVDAKNSSKGDLVDFLSKNLLHTEMYKSLHHGSDYKGFGMAFKTAAEKFSVIGDRQIPVIVSYVAKDENRRASKELVEEYLSLRSQFGEEVCRAKRRLLRELQAYAVNVFRNREAEVAAVAENVDDMFYYISEGYYNEQLGLSLNNELPFYCN